MVDDRKDIENMVDSFSQRIANSNKPTREIAKMINYNQFLYYDYIEKKAKVDNYSFEAIKNNKECYDIWRKAEDKKRIDRANNPGVPCFNLADELKEKLENVVIKEFSLSVGEVFDKEVYKAISTRLNVVLGTENKSAIVVLKKFKCSIKMRRYGKNKDRYILEDIK